MNTTDSVIKPGSAALVGGQAASMETTFQVQQFYSLEAEMLDEGRFGDWLEMLADDLHYWAPARTNRLRRQQALSIAEPGASAYYDETKESIAWRIRRFDTGLAWSEDPPSRSRHLITNVLVNEHPEGLVARSNFLVYRNRLEKETNIFVGGRTDLLRIGGTHGFEVSKRTLLFDANVLQAKNISTFF